MLALAPTRMSSRRRTVPRSLARHAPQTPSNALGSTTRASPPPGGNQGAVSPFYAPSFSNAPQATPSPGPGKDGHLGSTAAFPKTVMPSTLYSPVTHFAPAPLSSVRWIPTTQTAIAAVGSADGTPAADSVSLYSVESGEEGVSAALAARLLHPGRVHGMCAPTDGPALLVASSDGGIRAFRNSDAAKIDAGDSTEGMELVELGWMPKTAAGREAATGVAMLSHGRFCCVGAAGTLFVSSLEGAAGSTVQRGDAVGFRGVAAVDPEGAGDEVVAAGASGTASIWDFRTGGSSGKGGAPAQVLRHPNVAASMLGVTVDAAQPHFVLAGTNVGEVCIWDRRGGDGFPLNRIALHSGYVWDVRVVSSSRPGLLLSCGEDAGVWLMDFAAAAGRGAVGGVAATWRETGEFWRAEVGESDVRNVASDGGRMLGINSVDAHPYADLFAYASDSAAITFGSLYSTGRM